MFSWLRGQLLGRGRSGRVLGWDLAWYPVTAGFWSLSAARARSGRLVKLSSNSGEGLIMVSLTIAAEGRHE